MSNADQLRAALTEHMLALTLDRSVDPENIIASCSCPWFRDHFGCVLDAQLAWVDHMMKDVCSALVS